MLPSRVWHCRPGALPTPQQSPEKPLPPIRRHHVAPNHQGSCLRFSPRVSVTFYPRRLALTRLTPSTRFSLRPQPDENEGYGSSVRVLDELSPSFYRPKPQALPMGARPALPPPVLAVGDKPVRLVIRASIMPSISSCVVDAIMMSWFVVLVFFSLSYYFFPKLVVSRS